MVAVQLGHFRGHRAVDVDRQFRNAARRFQLPDEPEHLLRAADGERWDDERPAAVHRLGDDALQLD
jgi:hypothetical protein